MISSRNRVILSEFEWRRSGGGGGGGGQGGVQNSFSNSVVLGLANTKVLVFVVLSSEGHATRKNH